MIYMLQRSAAHTITSIISNKISFIKNKNKNKNKNKKQKIIPNKKNKNLKHCKLSCLHTLNLIYARLNDIVYCSLCKIDCTIIECKTAYTRATDARRAQRLTDSKYTE